MRILLPIAAAAMIIPGAAMAQTTGGGTTTGGTASGGSTTGGMNNGMSTGTIDQANPPTSTDGSTTSTDPQSVSKARGRTRGSTSRSRRLVRRRREQRAIPWAPVRRVAQLPRVRQVPYLRANLPFPLNEKPV